MFYLKLLSLKAWGCIIMALAITIGSLIIYADRFSHVAVQAVRQSQHEMKTIRDWRLK